MQHELEVSTKQPIFVDSSISDTIRTCIVLGNNRAALKVKTEFKVRDLCFSLNWSKADNIELCYILILVLFITWIRFQRNDGIGSKFLRWQRLGTGMPWKSFQRRKGLRLVWFYQLNSFIGLPNCWWQVTEFLYVVCWLIGFRPFVEACIDADEKTEAIKYIAKLADPREKAEVSLYLNPLTNHLI